MGKRTSDFVALAAIVSGAALGLGLTSLYAQMRADRVLDVDDSSVRVRVLRHNMVVEPGRIRDSFAEAPVVRHALIEPRQIAVGYAEALAPQLERLRTQVEELQLQAQETGDIEALLEALEGLEAIEDLDLEQDLTIDILLDDEDRRRRRRRRRPRQAAEGLQPTRQGTSILSRGTSILSQGTSILSRGRGFAPLSVLALCLLSACAGEGDGGQPEDPRLQSPLLRASQFNETAPDVFQARLETTAGAFVIEVHRDWAPLGADRFYNLVKSGWYDGARFYRVLENFTAGWGIHDNPYVNVVWQNQLLLDDPVTQRNTRGRVSFARSGANSRTTQVFVNHKDNPGLDDRFAPFGEVVEGMEVVDGLYSGYGDGPPRGEGVYQARALARGAEYFDAEFPELDRIERATIR